MSASHPSVIRVRRQLSASNRATVPTVCISAWTMFAKLLLSASETVSTSLVKKLMMSPLRRESNHESGRV